MGTVKVRYLETRTLADGTPAYYWINRHAKAQGLAAEALGSDLATAVRRAAKLNALWDEVRKGSRAPSEPVIPGTLAWLIDTLERSAAHAERPQRTRREVEACHRIIRKSPLGAANLTTIDRKAIRAFHRKLEEAVSRHHANKVVKWLRVLFTAAVEEGELKPGDNPMKGMRFKGTPARQVTWTESEILALQRQATEAGTPSISLAVELALDCGQREEDIIGVWEDGAWRDGLTSGDYDGESLRVRQNKGGRRIRVPVLPELKVMLDALPKRPGAIIMSERTGRPYKGDNFRHLFKRLREAAGVEGKWFQDLRRTSAVRLAEAGCSEAEIVAITGHSIEHGARILDIYAPRNYRMAQAAIDKVLAARRR